MVIKSKCATRYLHYKGNHPAPLVWGGAWLFAIGRYAVRKNPIFWYAYLKIYILAIKQDNLDV